MITFSTNPQGALVTSKRIGTVTVSYFQDPDHGVYDLLITQLMGPMDTYTWYHGQTIHVQDLNDAFQDPIRYAQNQKQP